MIAHCLVESTQREGDCSLRKAREAADGKSCHASCGLAQLDALDSPSSLRDSFDENVVNGDGRVDIAKEGLCVDDGW